MKVPLLDLKAQYHAIKDRILEVTQQVYESQYFILGPQVAALEKRIAEYCQVGHAVGVSSGTDALILSLMAAGIGPGDRVISTPYTFFATTGAIARVGPRRSLSTSIQTPTTSLRTNSKRPLRTCPPMC